MERRTDAHDGPLAVFLIGMTVRKPWRPDLWGPAFTAMPRMLRELEANRAASERGVEQWLGFLGGRTVVGAGGPTVIQYWRSARDLLTYASADGLAHRPAWQDFNAKARRAEGAVGIWHETYAVPAGAHESVYSGLGRDLGLGAFCGTVPVARRGDRAGDRLGRDSAA